MKLFSNQPFSSLIGRGGTEQIELMLIENLGYKKVTSEQLKNLEDQVLLIGLSLREIVKIKSSNMRLRPVILRSATYGLLRNFFEFSFFLFFNKWFDVMYLASYQKKIYPLGKKLNLNLLYEIENKKNTFSHPNLPREFKYGYIGRIDKKKGYFTALECLFRLSTRNQRCAMDLLVWSDGELRYLPDDSSGIEVSYGFRNKPAPTYGKFENLILPYEDLSTTIALPLVPVEAVLNGCTVYTTKGVQKLLLSEMPLLAPFIKNIGEIDD